MAARQTGTHRGAPRHTEYSALSHLVQGLTTYPNPAPISCQLYTLPDHDDDNLSSVASPSETPMQHVDEKPTVAIYDESPMDSLPYPPPTSSASPPYFHPHPPQRGTQDGVNRGSPSFVHDAMNTSENHWEDTSARVPRLTVPSQSYMLCELTSPVSTTFSQSVSQQYTSSSVTRSHRRQSRSPSPRSPLRLSPTPHTKRSLDKKPALACLFCRGRKIACGPPQPGSKDKTCK